MAPSSERKQIDDLLKRWSCQGSLDGYSLRYEASKYKQLQSRLAYGFNEKTSEEVVKLVYVIINKINFNI